MIHFDSPSISMDNCELPIRINDFLHMQILVIHQIHNLILTMCSVFISGRKKNNSLHTHIIILKVKRFLIAHYIID